ncbi:hypothetical protein NDU88_005792 [Pleurodeles waltl]|uniref:Uncharacterized protein n=1 Tax=Pleurodeles waltl TaxID=8319 RepID=A0AAV7VKY0_PLEWA|nr:hypothetical protein NDU88_005792 [Pleurodeles waltl]
MDRRVIQAMQLLREAGRLDLLAEPAARRDRPVRRAASEVVAAVAACSPPRGNRRRLAPQVRRAGGGRGRCVSATAPTGRVVGGSLRRPRPLGVRQPPSTIKAGDGGGLGAPSAPMAERARGRRSSPSGARPPNGGVSMEAGPAAREPAGFRPAGGVSHKKAGKNLPIMGGSSEEGMTREEGGMGRAHGEFKVGVGDIEGFQKNVEGGWEAKGGQGVRFQGMEWGYTVEGTGMSSPRGKDLSHILEWSDEAEQDGVMYCRLEHVQAETENGHMTDENGWEENKTRQMQIG